MSVARNTLSHLCYLVEFGRFGSNDTALLRRSPEKLTHRVPPFRVIQGHRNRHIDPPLGPISHRFRDKRRYQSKVIFPTLMHLTPPLKGFPLELGPDVRGQKPEWWGYRTEKDVWQSLQIGLQYTNVTDGHRSTTKTVLTHSVTR